MIDFTEISLEVGLKIISALTALVLLLQRTWSLLSNIRKKQSLKLDIEILDTASKNPAINKEHLETHVSKKIHELYSLNRDRTSSYITFLVALIFFTGFSWFTIDIYNKSNGFNGWMILTSFMAVVGLGGMFGFDKEDKEKNRSIKPYFTLEVYSKNGFISSVVLLIFSAVSSFITYTKVSGFSMWLVLFSLLGLLAIFMLIREIKIRIDG